MTSIQSILSSVRLFLLACAAVVPALGSEIRITGNAGWRINGSDCTLTLDGIENNSPEGSRSGSLRVCLWLTRSTFPETGYRVATANLQPLNGGYVYSGLTLRTKSRLPRVTGEYLFTISVEEFTSNGWITNDHRKIGFKYLKSGKFSKPPAWKPPGGKVITPRAKVKPGDQLTITLQGSQKGSGSQVVYVPKGSQLKLKIRIDSDGMTTVFGGSRPEGAPALYRYSRTKDKYNGKSMPVGRLYLDYGSVDPNAGGESYSDLRLFFQKTDRGFYKSIDAQQAYDFKGTSWGIFRLN